MHELFGSDSEDEGEAVLTGRSATHGEVDEEHTDDGVNGGEPPGNDNGNGGDGLDSGDDDERGSAREPPSVSAVPSGAPLHLELPELPKPPVKSQLHLVRLPNILSIQSRPYSLQEDETLQHELEVQLSEGSSEAAGRLRTENVIRWRSNAETSDPTRLCQSNAKLVRWSDGSMTLHLGAEVLAAMQQPLCDSSTQLFTRHRGSNLECHGMILKKLAFQPSTIASSTHRTLTEQIARSHRKESKIKMTTTTQDPERKKIEDERTWDEKNRLTVRQQARARGERDRRPNFSAEFLDDDDEAGMEGNLGAIRRNFRKSKQSAAALHAAGGSRRGRGSAGKSYDDRSGDEEAEEGEFDDFFDEDDDEVVLSGSEELLDGEEEEDSPPIKKHRRGS